MTDDAGAGTRHGILIVGGGFAGTWAAAAAARVRHDAGVSPRALPIVLVSPGDDLVLRPRLYQDDPASMRVALDRVLAPIAVRRRAATVTDVDATARVVTATGRDGTRIRVPYERLVIAAGSAMTRPQLPGADRIHDVDTLEAAVALDVHLRRLAERPPSAGRLTAVVVGGGFTGIELASELPQRLEAVAAACGAAERVRVVLAEREPVVGPELGAGPRPAIEAALASLGVERRLGVSLRAFDGTRAYLSDDSEIPTATVVWTAGMRAAELTRRLPGVRDRLGRLEVDAFLRMPAAPGVLAAGDVAAACDGDGHPVMQSCQHALQLGPVAGHNAAAELLKRPLVRFAPHPYVTCLDLGAAGALFARGWERAVEVVGEEAKRRKRFINEQYIVPPLDDPAALLQAAPPRGQ